MAYGKDHHHYPEAYCLSVYADHQEWVGLVVEVMMVECCTVQDCHSYLGHCQAAVIDPVEGRCWCCCQWLCCHLDWMELSHQCCKRKSRTTDLQSS